jgi:cell division protein FtsW (lipid II flippase)
MIAALQLVMQTASSTASTTIRRVAYVPESHVDFIFSFSVQRERVSILALAILAAILLTIMLIVKRRRVRRRPSSAE